MTDHTTWASADASRVSTRSGEWREQMTNLALAELDMALDGLREVWHETPTSYEARAIVATSLIDGTAERLERLGAA